MVRRSRSQKRGFTLIELLVVISIIGMLAALLLPAVNTAREAARRAVCNSQTRQLALAIANFEASRSRYPGMVELVGNNNAPWLVAIMSYIERQDIYDDFQSAAVGAIPTTGIGGSAGPIYIKVLRCPSNPPTNITQGQNSYICNAGYVASNNMNAANTVPKGDGVFIDRSSTNYYGSASPAPTTFPPNSVRTQNLYDGLSNVLLTSENLLATDWGDYGQSGGTTVQAFTLQTTPLKIGSTFVWHAYAYAGGSATPPTVPVPWKINGDRVNATTKGPLSAQTAPITDYLRPSSIHPGGVNASFADGHTVFLKDSVDYWVYQQLMTTNHTASSVVDTSGFVTYKLRDIDYE